MKNLTVKVNKDKVPKYARSELRYENSVWNVLIILSAVCLIICIAGTVKEADLYFNGSYIDAAYNERNKTASYLDTNHDYHIYNLGTDIFTAPKGKDGHVRLYYKADLDKATFLTKWYMWALYYIVFMTLMSVGLWRRSRNINACIQAAQSERLIGKEGHL